MGPRPVGSQNMMRKYCIQTLGCQMNVADSRYVSDALSRLGLEPTEDVREADLVVLNTCVVREQAERKARGRLAFLGSLKKRKPDLVIALMGCLVGFRKDRSLEKSFPFVDLFLAPSEFEPLLSLVGNRLGRSAADRLPATGCSDREIPLLPASDGVTALVPAVIGCSHTCAFCVIPYRRGPEKSRPMAVILEEARHLAARGIVEITLLGQIIDRYGLDLDADHRLPRLLNAVAAIEGISRVRFLTSHPAWMDDGIIRTVAGNDKVCPQFEIAVQSGNDEVLQRMRRGHTSDDFRRLVDRIREAMPDAAIHTDVIVGFPGETEKQFLDTCRLLEQLRLDKVHVAAYSERPGTFAARHYPDDVPPEEKKRRLKIVEQLQREIQLKKNRALVGSIVEILVESRKGSRWYGRTPQNRIVFATCPSAADLRGKLVSVRITDYGPYSLIGEIVTPQ